jgi:hypothetical protein
MMNTPTPEQPYKAYIRYPELPVGVCARVEAGLATRAHSAVFADQLQAPGLDLEAEGFTRMFADVPLPVLQLDRNLTEDEIIDGLLEAPLPPAGKLVAVLTSPYRLDLVRAQDYEAGAGRERSIMGSDWSTPHPEPWLTEATSYGLMVVLIPGFHAQHQQPGTGLENLRYAWFAAAGIATADQPPGDRRTPPGKVPKAA